MMVMWIRVQLRSEILDGQGVRYEEARCQDPASAWRKTSVTVCRLDDAREDDTLKLAQTLRARHRPFNFRVVHRFEPQRGSPAARDAARSSRRPTGRISSRIC